MDRGGSFPHLPLTTQPISFDFDLVLMIMWKGLVFGIHNTFISGFNITCDNALHNLHNIP